MKKKISKVESRISKLEKILNSKTINLNARKLLSYELRVSNEKLIYYKDEELRLKQLAIAEIEQQDFNKYLDSIFEGKQRTSD